MIVQHCERHRDHEQTQEHDIDEVAGKVMRHMWGVRVLFTGVFSKRLMRTALKVLAVGGVCAAGRHRAARASRTRARPRVSRSDHMCLRILHAVKLRQGTTRKSSTGQTANGEMTKSGRQQNITIARNKTIAAFHTLHRPSFTTELKVQNNVVQRG